MASKNDIINMFSVESQTSKGAKPRYERNKSSNSSNCTLETSNQRSLTASILATHTPTKLSVKKRTPSKLYHTPKLFGDRFIPCRRDLSLAQYKMSCNNETDSQDGNKPSSRIFCYNNKAPTAPEGFQNPLRVLYSQAKTPASAKSTRYIPQAPDRILDAPDIVDDFYLNLIDWSSNNIVAAALGSAVYLWNAGTGNISQLLETEDNTDYVCSLSWIQDGNCLAVGTSQGTVQLWDCAKSKRLRLMSGHSARIGSLAWNLYVLSSGCRSGQLIHHDVRQKQHIISTINAHSQEICGLKWSPDGKYLASGGNDNTLNVWEKVSGGGHHGQTDALHTFTQHQAAVKALAWCPWHPHILASGGGTADRHIRVWNCNIGNCVNSVDTRSQVSSLLWAQNYKELVSGHGFANNEVIIWKYPSMTKVAELTGHTSRVLHIAMSPDGTTILSAGADETLRFWNCFAKDPVREKAKSKKLEPPSALRPCIR